MKEVLSISAHGKFVQYLKKSEVRFVVQIAKDKGEAIVNVVEITNANYKATFG